MEKLWTCRTVPLLRVCVSIQELQCSFTQICSEEPGSILEKLLLSEQPERFRKAQTFIGAQGLGPDSVAELVSSAVVQALVLSNQELQPGENIALSSGLPGFPSSEAVCACVRARVCVRAEKRQVFRPSEGRDSLVQLIKLCEDPNLVGVKLLENLSCVPLRDLNCSELSRLRRRHRAPPPPEGFNFLLLVVQSWSC